MKSDEKGLVESDLLRLETLFQCGIFEREKAGHELFRSAVVDMIICLHETLQAAKRECLRVDFKEDVLLGPEIKDVTDAVRMIRDACCHTGSGRTHVNSPQTRAVFFVNLRVGDPSMNLGGFSYVNDYEDDIAIFFGKHRLYLKRQAFRAYTVARAALGPLLR